MPEHTWVVSWDCEADGDDEPLHVQGMSVNAWCHFIEKKPRRKKPGKRRPFDPEKIFAAMSVFSVVAGPTTISPERSGARSTG